MYQHESNTHVLKFRFQRSGGGREEAGCCHRWLIVAMQGRSLQMLHARMHGTFA
jgi:hypothetical protein